MHEVTYLCARLSKRLRNTAMLDSPSGIELFVRNCLNHIGHALYPHVQNSSSILILFLKYTTYVDIPTLHIPSCYSEQSRLLQIMI